MAVLGNFLGCALRFCENNAHSPVRSVNGTVLHVATSCVGAVGTQRVPDQSRPEVRQCFGRALHLSAVLLSERHTGAFKR